MASESAYRHQTPLEIIQLSLNLFLKGPCSFRGVRRCLEAFGEVYNVAAPSYGTVRHWLYRVGLYLLQNTARFDGDWIMILDHTIQLGREKCLVVLGVQVSRLEETGYALRHKDVRVLGMDIVTESTGEFVHEFLEELIPQFGVPKQIVSDHGSDLKKGIRLYQQDRPDVVHTYDISHGAAALLKSELSKDEIWQSFTTKTAACAARLQQTDLEFLRPPSPRKKARFMNLSALVNWGVKILEYLNAGDFHEINPSFVIVEEQGELLLKKCGINPKDLKPIMGKLYDERAVFEQALRNHLPENVTCDQIDQCIATGSLGRARFEKELGWVKEFAMELKQFQRIFEVSNKVQEWVKRRGLHQETSQDVRKVFEIEAMEGRPREFANRLLEFVQREGDKVREAETWLGSSDIIESMFGKYKYFAERSPQKTMGNLLLVLPLLTQEFNTSLIKLALETIGMRALDEWKQKVFGVSSTSKRRSAFKHDVVPA